MPCDCVDSVFEQFAHVYFGGTVSVVGKDLYHSAEIDFKMKIIYCADLFLYGCV